MEQSANEQKPQELNAEDSNEITWETNHEKITEALRYLQRKEVKVTVSNIAQLTKLTRKTIYKHFQEGGANPIRKINGPLNRFMLDEVIERICRKACYGDLKAAKLYLEIMGVIQQNNCKVNTNVLNYNNTITVKEQVLTEEIVQNLSAENLSQLEEFVKSATQAVPQGGGQNAEHILTNSSVNQ